MSSGFTFNRAAEHRMQLAAHKDLAEFQNQYRQHTLEAMSRFAGMEAVQSVENIDRVDQQLAHFVYDLNQ